MQILAHRGSWKDKKEQNTLEAFKRAFDLGFGIELDVRYLYGEVVIEHDCVIVPGVPTLKDVLKLRNKRPLTIAINVKEDGLSELIKKDLEGETDYFCFDMSIPEMFKYSNLGLNTFQHHSDFVKSDFRRCARPCITGVWIDSFSGKFVEPPKYGFNGGDCFVSNELHGNDHKPQWKKLKRKYNDYYMLCTDFPEEANEYFNGPKV